MDLRRLSPAWLLLGGSRQIIIKLMGSYEWEPMGSHGIPWVPFRDPMGPPGIPRMYYEHHRDPWCVL